MGLSVDYFKILTNNLIVATCSVDLQQRTPTVHLGKKRLLNAAEWPLKHKLTLNRFLGHG